MKKDVEISENSHLVKKLLEGEELTFEEAEKIGDSSTINENHPIKYSLSKKGMVGFGSYGTYYDIAHKDDNLVVKIPNDSEELDILINGKEIQEHGYHGGLKCPKPEGMYNVYNPETKKFKVGFVMQKVKGRPLRHLERGIGVDKETLDYFYKMRDHEFSKLDKLGLIPNDILDDKNILCDPETKDYHIIDFDLWRKR